MKLPNQTPEAQALSQNPASRPSKHPKHPSKHTDPAFSIQIPFFLNQSHKLKQEARPKH